MVRIQGAEPEKRFLGIEMGGMKREERGNFPEKKISKGMGKEARDFSEKIFFRNFKILRDLSCASRPTPQGPPPPPYNGVFAMFEAIWRPGTVQKVQMYTAKNWIA